MRIGITGHQRLDDPTAWPWVTRQVEKILDEQTPPLIAVTSLAIGADQLLARLVLARSGVVQAILPFANLERSFKKQDLASYYELVRQSLPEILDTPGDDEDAYLAAGRRVVDLSNLMIAVWNGRPAKGKGGTADVVVYARMIRIKVIHLNPDSRTVISMV